ncbi:MAG: cyclic nucleotide-binding domain-containing protein [Cytophagales bacterium]|nr:cyclic nucleotide-binding domain-containing protein [Cytophagales bacterium]
MKNPFRKSYSVKEMNLFRFLTRSKLFEKLSNDELAPFLPHLHLRRFKCQEVIFFRGDPAQAFYLIKSGVISLNLDIKDKFEILTRLRSGAFGEGALMQNTKRSYNAIVESDSCELYIIPQANFFEVFDHNVIIKAKVLNSLAELYHQYNTNLFRAYKSSYGFFEVNKIYKMEDG